MTRRLTSFVHVGGKVYGPDDNVPAEVAAKIGDHAWDGPFAVPAEDETEATPPVEVSEYEQERPAGPAGRGRKAKTTL